MKQDLIAPHASSPLKVEFDSLEDRYTHDLYLDGSAGTKKIFSSVEGTSQQPWPPSPVLQQIERCDLGQPKSGQSQVGLVGLGLAGTSHWSIAVEVGTGLEFDVACRIREVPDFLGSTYQTYCSGQLSSDGRECRFDLGDGDFVTWELIEGQISQQEEGFVVIRDAKEGPYPTTFRRRCRIRPS